jgi:uncharacterized protein YcfL
MKNITKQLAIVACGAFLLAGCSTTPHAKAWEYKTVVTENQDGLSQLNGLGKDGWVLVGFTFSPRSQTGLNDEYHYVFKRLQK